MLGSRAHWVPDSQRGSNYGLGIMSHKVAGQTIVGHSGAMLTHHSATYTSSTTKTTVAVMATSKQVPVNQILMGIFEALDYLAAHTPSQPMPNARFTATLQNLIGTRHIIGLEDKVVSVFIDDWYPFDQVEEMAIVDDTTLKITQTHDLQAEGEFVQYTFAGDAIVSVRFAGITMWPKGVFSTWLLQKSD